MGFERIALVDRKEPAMPPRQHRYDAFVVGEHDLPDEAFDLRLRDGYVVVHDRTTDRWSVMSPSAFEREYEWA